MTLSAYAASRGLSQPTVSKAVKRGRLRASVGRTTQGLPCILDAELADREWAQNTSTHNIPHEYQRPPPVGGLTPVVAPVTRPPETPPSPPVGTSSPPDSPPADRPAPPADARLPSPEELAQGTALERWYSSELKRLKVEELEGTLVLAADVEREWTDILTMVRTKVLGLPTVLRQALPSLSPGDADVIDREVRALLTDLSTPRED